MRSKHELLKQQLNSMQNDLRMKDEKIDHLTREIQNLVWKFVLQAFLYKTALLGRKVQ